MQSVFINFIFPTLQNIQISYKIIKTKNANALAGALRLTFRLYMTFLRLR
jgi:hypothetical protein